MRNSIQNKIDKYYANEELAIEKLNSIRSNRDPIDIVVIDNKYEYGIQLCNKYRTTVIWTIVPIDVEE